MTMNLETLSYEQARKAKDARFDGRFFVAVKSTGIFCRPICPAPSPKEINVEYYPLAQLAMQAGYRPCLRCRPDSAPCSFAWKGVDTTVERAVKLIEAHPNLNLIEICEKLGVTDRYLRVLFSQKLGIAPKKYRLYGQLLFAKQLLHQTSLSVEEVAQASGFSSARRLQSNLKTALKLTPSQIRQGSVNKDDESTSSVEKKAADASLHLQISYRIPYDWPHLRDFLAARAIEGVESVTSESYSKVFRLGQCKGSFTATHNQHKNRFDVDLKIDDLSAIQNVVAEIRRILDCNTDPIIIDRSLKSTGVPVEKIRQGLRIPGVWDPFEAGCRAILGQQISVKAAINLVTLLCQELGEKWQDRIIFPTAEAIAASSLSFLKMPDKRRDCLRNFAEFNVRHPNPSQLEDWLSIKGIGPWTVAYAKMRGKSNPDIWLDSDLIIKKQIQRYSLDPSAAAAWRSYLTFQLWSMA